MTYIVKLAYPPRALTRVSLARDNTRSDVTPQFRARHMRELRRMAALQADLGVDVTPYQAMPQLLNAAWGYYLWARRKAGSMREHEFWITDPRTKEKIPCAEFELEQRLATTVRMICESMIRTDLDERGRKIEEAKVEILAVAVAAAAEEAGLDDGQKRKLGSELRRQLAMIQEVDE